MQYFLHCVLTYLLTYFKQQSLLEEVTGVQLVKKFPACYEARSFITALASLLHLSISWASSIQSIPSHPTSWRFILILSSHLHLCLPNGFFPSGFPTKTLHMSVLSPIHATCPTHPILLDFITQTILDEQYRFLSSSLSCIAYRIPTYLLTYSFHGAESFLRS